MFEECTSAIATHKPEIVFFGDSITQNWKGKSRLFSEGNPVARKLFSSIKTTTAGISGDRSEHLLWRLNNGQFGKHQPKMVVLMIGVNNLNAGDRADDVAAGIIALTNALTKRLPQSKILLLGPFPSHRAGKNLFGQTVEIHKTLATQKWGKNVLYRDLSASFSKNGLLKKEFYRDGIHLKMPAYVIWGNAVLKEFQR